MFSSSLDGAEQMVSGFVVTTPSGPNIKGFNPSVYSSLEILPLVVSMSSSDNKSALAISGMKLVSRDTRLRNSMSTGFKSAYACQYMKIADNGHLPYFVKPDRILHLPETHHFHQVY